MPSERGIQPRPSSIESHTPAPRTPTRMPSGGNAIAVSAHSALLTVTVLRVR